MPWTDSWQRWQAQTEVLTWTFPAHRSPYHRISVKIGTEALVPAMK